MPNEVRVWSQEPVKNHRTGNVVPGVVACLSDEFFCFDGDVSPERYRRLVRQLPEARSPEQSFSRPLERSGSGLQQMLQIAGRKQDNGIAIYLDSIIRITFLKGRLAVEHLAAENAPRSDELTMSDHRAAAEVFRLLRERLGIDAKSKVQQGASFSLFGSESEIVVERGTPAAAPPGARSNEPAPSDEEVAGFLGKLDVAPAAASAVDLSALQGERVDAGFVKESAADLMKRARNSASVRRPWWKIW